MPRTTRFLLENAFYHIMSRGNQKQIVFKINKDYQQYLRLLKKYKNKFDVLIFGYCLMPNHVHLLIMPNSIEYLPKFMQGLNQSYALYFNARHKTCGHLWQGRFKSMVINSERYLLECIEYVEQNPVRAQMAQSAVDYEWSSCRLRLLGKSDDILSLFQMLDKNVGTSFNLNGSLPPHLEKGHTSITTKERPLGYSK